MNNTLLIAVVSSRIKAAQKRNRISGFTNTPKNMNISLRNLAGGLGGGGRGARNNNTNNNAPAVTQPGGDDGEDGWDLMPPGGGEGEGEDEGEGGSVLGVQSVATSSDGSGGSGGGGDGNGGRRGGGTTSGGDTPTFGFAAIIAREGKMGKGETSVAAELAWQREVKGDKAKNDAFVEQVLAKQHFQAFAFMKPGSPWVHMGHGLGKFFAYTNTVPDLEGKVLMFVGDRRGTRDPMVVQPPVQTTWKWASVIAVLDAAALAAYCQTDGGTGLWRPGPGEGTGVEVKVPYVLALPFVLMEFMVAKGQCRPHQLLEEIVRLEGGYSLAAGAWELVKQWCLVAAQAKDDGNSHVALQLVPAFSAEEVFLMWCERRMDNTLGVRSGGQGGGGAGQAQLLAHTAHAVQNMGNQMVAGIQAAMTGGTVGGARKSEGAASGTGGYGREYSKSHIAQLKGFCGTDDARKIPSIWYIFTQTKDFDLYRVEIESRMEGWSREKGVEIDSGMYLEDESLKVLAQLQFNPSGSGAGVALAQSADKGLSILLCRPRTLAEVERVRDTEQATAAAAATLTVDQAKKLKPGAACKPPEGTYLDLKLLIGTFCGLLWTLFGSGCDYYHELKKIHKSLCTKDVAAIREAFTVDKCRHIIWAIIDDGRAFFRQKMTVRDFEDPHGYNFPQSLLAAMTREVRYAQLVERPFYPKSWEIRYQADRDGVTAKGRGIGGTGGQGKVDGGPPSPGKQRHTGGGGGYGAATPRGGVSAGGGTESGGWTDDRHPTIKRMMRDYEATAGLGMRISLGRVLNAAKREITDLPVIPAYVENGRPYVCWAHILGRCHFGDKCSFARGHPPRQAIPDSFAEEVVNILGAGIAALVDERQARRPPSGSPPGKRAKGEDAEQ